MAVAVSPALSTDPILQVKDVAVSFGPVRALDGIDLDVAPGEVVALAGENGAGKSTLVRCIAGDMAPNRGQITVAGRRVGADPVAAAKRGVAVVWQDLALCDNLDVASNLLLGRETGRLMRSDTRFHAAAGALLNQLQIPLADTTRNVRSLSGGQRQILAVARAMRDRPKLLVLDEPTAALGVGWSTQVEELTRRLRDEGTTIVLVSHDIEQMFRLAGRIAVLRHGRIVAEVDPAHAHPDDVVALMSGQQVDASARRQLGRLQGLVDRLTSADPSSSLLLIGSALGAALAADQLCIHLVEGDSLRAAGTLGLPAELARHWARLPTGANGGPIGVAAATETTVVDADVRSSTRWALFRQLAVDARIGSSWSVPVVGANGLTGVITVLRRGPGRPGRDELDLVSVYAGYVASAVERDRLLGQVTARNRVLETIREVLETLAGPVSLTGALASALGALRAGLQADEVGLIEQRSDRAPRWRALVDATGARSPAAAPPPDTSALDFDRCDGTARSIRDVTGRQLLAVTFRAPGGPAALIARIDARTMPAVGVGSDTDPDTAFGAGWESVATSLLEDAARSLQLALEREETERAHQEAAALRRSQELQGGFLSRLSHELRTPLTAIQGYASSLMQSDVVWDGASQHRFLSRIALESARLGRLVDDLLDLSAIESDILRLQPDWCDLKLVLDAAAACLPPAGAEAVTLSCHPFLPVTWADHDRLEQVFVNLMDNALRHNPPGTSVEVTATPLGTSQVQVTVVDHGGGLPDSVAAAPFEPRRRRRGATAGAGLGLSIAKGIVDAHGGTLSLERLDPGTCFRIRLPIEAAETADARAETTDGA